MKTIELKKYLVCECGWKSHSYEIGVPIVAIGGILSCPKCTKAKRNPTLEGQYGHVHIEDERGYRQCSACGEFFGGIGNASPIPCLCMKCWLKVSNPKKNPKK